jgi:uncharacterized protein YdhG (YjbR/CyaY superfamily)
MKIEAVSVNDYFDKVPEERKLAMDKLRTSINSNLPDGYEERLGYGMPSWVVPHSIYPAGYHANTKLPLPFMSIASQKNFIGLYHMGIYADVKLLKWWEKEYAQYCTKKIDMGKSCIRLKHLDDIPYDLIAELCTKISVDKWVKIYEENIKR